MGGAGERLLSNVLFTGSWTYNLWGGAYKFCQFWYFVPFLYLTCLRFLPADKYSVGLRKEISLEIKPTSHTGLLLSSWNAKGDYIVLEMSNGNVSNVLGRCDAFNLNWSKLWCKVNPSKVGSIIRSWETAHLPLPLPNINTYFTLRAK